MVTVELGGAVVDGVDDQGAGAVVPGTGHGSDEGIEEKIAAGSGSPGPVSIRRAVERPIPVVDTTRSRILVLSAFDAEVPHLKVSAK